MKFFIEQIAICPANPATALELLQDIGAQEWVRDTVVAKGTVRRGDPGAAGVTKTVINEAELAFNYELGQAHPDKELEFEILHYTIGHNWMANNEPSVSHLGMHCDEIELEHWKQFFSERQIHIAQEVVTLTHINPAIAGKRSYRYCIFDTRSILGVDLKFIVRIEAEQDDG
jgi:hypothetical protein